MSEVILETNLPGVELLARGKVRDMYDLGDRLLIVTTDRISAFDCILPTGIPDKGQVLTAMSRFWFRKTADIVPNHLADEGQSGEGGGAEDRLPAALRPLWSGLKSRSMIVKKAEPYSIECVARGYLSGSAWKEYRAAIRAGLVTNNAVPCCGVMLPVGLTESARLPQAVFTPATKATTGHDENIDFNRACQIVGPETAGRLRDYTLRIYQRAADYALGRGIIIADTKFEFGLTDEGIILIDEALTPDSSRFWDAATYQPGRSQPSFDKQIVRDYLETLDWDKTPPAPALPPEITARTSTRYRDAYRLLVGEDLPA
jgi:phosphoribosylaminoimidazole-succinocarboxamide synthase